VALDPRTVYTPLAAPSATAGLIVRPPVAAALQMLAVIDALTPPSFGAFFDPRGRELPW
jgi:hypothetical protein